MRDIDNYPIKAILISCPHTGFEYVPAASPDIGRDGNKAYYICSVCGKWYSDAAGTMEISDHSSVIIPALTKDPGDEPTNEPTDEPTDEPTNEPTDKPVDVPTEKPAEKPTDKPEKETDASVIVSSESEKAHDKASADNIQDNNPSPSVPEFYATGESGMSASVMFLVALMAFSISIISITLKNYRKHYR